MTMIKQILKVKGDDHFSVGPDEAVYAAIEKMAEKNVGAVLVMDGATLVGIFTERDLLRLALGVKSYRRLRLDKVMTRNPESLRPKDRLAYALNKMSVGRFRHVPLVDERNVPVGMISGRDVLDFLVELLPEAVLNLPSSPELAMHRTVEGD